MNETSPGLPDPQADSRTDPKLDLDPALTSALALDDCGAVLAQVYEFLDHEIDTADGDRIRRHLQACEPCLETFDAEQALKALLHRSCGGDVAPAHLRVRVMAQITATQVSGNQVSSTQVTTTQVTTTQIFHDEG